MKRESHTQKHIDLDAVRKKLRIRQKQLDFDSYPKDFADFLTRIGRNPYEKGFEERIQYRDFTVNTKGE